MPLQMTLALVDSSYAPGQGDQEAAWAGTEGLEHASEGCRRAVMARHAAEQQGCHTEATWSSLKRSHLGQQLSGPQASDHDCTWKLTQEA